MGKLVRKKGQTKRNLDLDGRPIYSDLLGWFELIELIRNGFLDVGEKRLIPFFYPPGRAPMSLGSKFNFRCRHGDNIKKPNKGILVLWTSGSGKF